ncbi:hypothetical protein [Mammaliicoccus sp. G-M30]|uniref:hypothetical protein n=1 Tax=Mammaliicoccus sp. G-M30 TaxID=2898689 RepID=UPI001EFAA166|nr:hypothetical protein [Mammaliicoccus sp. G-M30]
MKYILSYISFSVIMLILLTIFNLIFSDGIEWTKNVILSVITYPIYLFFDWALEGNNKK